MTPFSYRRAESVQHAVELLTEHGDEAKLLAGGHSLLPLMKLRLASPSVLIDVGRITDLSYIREEDGSIAIGALTRHCDIAASQLLAAKCPLLSHVAGEVGDPQVRHRGTIGGSLCHGDPASDLPAVVLALGGTLVAHGAAGSRTIAMTNFNTGFLETALAPGEVLTEIRVPLAPAWGYEKFNRRAQDWAIVGVAVARSSAVGVSLVNMGATVLRATAVEQALADGATAAEAAAHAADDAEPPSDINASAQYRQHLARVLVRRALQSAGID